MTWAETVEAFREPYRVYIERLQAMANERGELVPVLSIDGVTIGYIYPEAVEA